MIGSLLGLAACSDKVPCPHFDLSHPFLQIGISPDLKDTLQYQSNLGNSLTLTRTSLNLTAPYLQECGVTQDDCPCESLLDARYSDLDAQYAFGFNISDQEALNGEWRLCDYLIYPNPAEISFDRVDCTTENVAAFLDSVGTDSIIFNNKLYQDIMIFEDKSDTVTQVWKVWIKRNKGMIKFWIGGEYFSLVE